ncbi:MAG: hypothetical protein C6W54_11095 [Bacillaceae bacterium]|nr:MAG: hypothetical protein C6W54_11095 [Bacillaceae bacterium]
MNQTYWEPSVRQFFDEWKNMKTPLQHPEHFKSPQQEKKLLTIDDLQPIIKKSQQSPKKKKRGRPKKKSVV